MSAIVDMYETVTSVDFPQTDDAVTEMRNNNIQEALKILDQRNWTNVEEFINPWGEQWLTLAHLAAYRGNIEILKRPINIEARDKFGRSPLHYAAEQGHLDAVKWLLESATIIWGPNSCGNVSHLQKDKKLDKTKLISRIQEIFSPKNHTIKPSGSRPKSSAHPQLSLEDFEKNTALHLAVRAKHTDVVKVLLKAHIDEVVEAFHDNSPNINGNKFCEAWDVQPIYLAAYHGDYEMFERPYYYFDTDKLGRSVLHYAAEQGQISMIKYLLEPFTDMLPEPVVDTLDYIPLSWSDNEREIERSTGAISVSVLRQVFQQDFLGMTPLHYAAEQGHANVVNFLVKYLLLFTRKQFGLTASKLSLRDSNDMSALHLAIKGKHTEVTYVLIRAHFETAIPNLDRGVKKSADVAEFLTSWHVESNHLAAYSGNLEVLKSASNLYAKDKFGRCTLHYAADQGHINAIKWLLEQTTHEKLCQLSLKDSNGMTPLHLAVRAGHVEVVKILVDAGAEVNALNNEKVSPIFLAHCHFDRRTLGPEELSRYEAIVDILVSAKVSVEEPHPNERLSVLHYAVLLNSQRATQQFCEYRKYLIIRKVGGQVVLPLHLAAKYGYNEVLKSMLKFLPSSWIDIQSLGFSALHVACIAGNFDCARSLIDKGASLADKDDMGNTAISSLCQHKNYLKLGPFLTEILDAKVRLKESRTLHDISRQTDDIDLNFDIFASEKRTHVYRNEDVSHMTMLLDLMEKLPREDQAIILEHPLLKTYNAMKWWHLRYFFWGLVIFQFLLAVDISFYAIYMQKDTVASNLRRMLLNLAGIPFCFSLVQIFTDPKRYFRKIENCLQLSCLTISIAVAVGGEFIPDPTTSWIRYFVSVAVPLIWIQAMLSVGQFGGWASYIFIFPVVLKNSLKVFVLGFWIVVGFAIGFMVLFRNSDLYRDFFSSDTSSMVYDPHTIENGEMYPPVISRTVFFVFMTLTGFVLVNLMLGLAVDDIRRLIAEGEFSRLLKQAEFITDCERMEKSCVIQKCHLHNYLKPKTPTHLRFKRTDRPFGFSKDLVDQLFNLAQKKK